MLNKTHPQKGLFNIAVLVRLNFFFFLKNIYIYFQVSQFCCASKYLKMIFLNFFISFQFSVFFCIPYSVRMEKNSVFGHFSRRNRGFTRSTCSQMFFKIGVIKNFAIFTGKQLLQSLLIMLPKACNVFKKRLEQMCFSVNTAKRLITAFLQNTPGGCF